MFCLTMIFMVLDIAGSPLENLLNSQYQRDSPDFMDANVSPNFLQKDVFLELNAIQNEYKSEDRHSVMSSLDSGSGPNSPIQNNFVTLKNTA